VIDVSSIMKADGVAVGDDGTLYFTTPDAVDGWVGRVVGQSIEMRWLRVARAVQLRGLAIDHARKRLYVADDTNDQILSYDLTASLPSATVVVSGLAGINEIALDAAGTIFFSGPQLIYRVVQGKAVAVSSEPVGELAKDQGPGGLAFAADGSLFAGIRKGGAIVKLTLTNGAQSGRARFGTFDGWINGLAFDRDGRLYAGLYDLTVDTNVVRVAVDGLSSTSVSSGGRFASLAFGRGSLDCRDLYVANPAGSMRRIRTDTPGLRLP
jgi:sugar lactone lactonase YvrE